MVLMDLKWGTCQFYLDDVMVFSKTFDEHLHKLDKVLTANKQAGLRPKMKKNAISERRVSGHVVDQIRAYPDQEK